MQRIGHTAVCEVFSKVSYFGLDVWPRLTPL